MKFGKWQFDFKADKYKYMAYFLVFIGVLVRIYRLGIVPGGMNQDEAFAGYEAYSLLHYGIDSSGYHNPVYFVSWGSGMNVLNSYLMLPLIKIFGLHPWVVRTPQMLVAIFSLIVLYKLLKKIYNEKAAVIGLFLLVISPWHIMLSRWALESNLAPGFLLFGLYFFVLGIEKPKYYIASALAYGLSLYCYSTIWTIVPVILLLQFIYLIYHKKFKFNKEICISGAVLLVLAVPLLLFIIINAGYMEEIRTGIISIPKMVYMRDNEVSFSNILGKFYNLYRILTTQNDGLLWNTTEEFGLYYRFSLPFIVLGAFDLCRTVFGHIKRKEFSLKVFLLIQLLTAVLLGLLINVNINRINCIHISIIICLALGICRLGELIKKEVVYVVIFLYSISFIGFQAFYHTDYRDAIAQHFQEGLEEAVDYAMDREGTIYVAGGISYPKILFYSRLSAEEYVNTVKYTNYPSAFLDISECGRFRFGADPTHLDSEGIYIISSGDASVYMEAGCIVEPFNGFSVAYMAK